MLDFPLTPDEFRARLFERSPQHWPRALQGQPIALTDLDHVLDLLEPQEQTLQLFNRGLVPQQQYTRDGFELGQARRRLDKTRFYGQLREGATLVLNRFEARSTAASRLCGEVARFAGLQTTSNAYVSFTGTGTGTGTGTFGKHWDTHDVFAIQLLGRKRWQVFEPTFPLPLAHQTSEVSGQQPLGRPHLDIVLEAGDVLYVPRGWWHHVLPLAEPSLHLSVGTYAATINDYLLWMCSQWLPQQPHARQAFSTAADNTAAIEPLVERLRSLASDPQVMRQFQRELERRESHCAEIDLARHVTMQPIAFDDAATLRLNTSFTPSLEQNAITVNGQRLQLDGLSYRIVDVLRRDACMSLRALGACMVDVPRETLDRTLLALAQHDVLTIANSH